MSHRLEFDSLVKVILENALPFLLVNMAMSADGKIATANRSVTTFGSAHDLNHLYELRSTTDAILCGARTVEETGATLGNGEKRFLLQRRRRGLADYPLRVVVSGSASLRSDIPLWGAHPSPVIVLVNDRAPKPEVSRLRKLADEVWVSEGPELDLAATLRCLRQTFGVRRMVGEGGPTLNDALFRAHLVDELHLTICPVLVGGREAPTISEGVGFTQLQEGSRWELSRRKIINGEVFLTYRAGPRNPGPE